MFLGIQAEIICCRYLFKEMCYLTYRDGVLSILLSRLTDQKQVFSYLVNWLNLLYLCAHVKKYTHLPVPG